jgi:hypothetical protein
MPLLTVPDRQLSLFCPKGTIIFKPKKNLRIGEAELSMFMSEELAGIFPSPMLEEFQLMNKAGGPALIEIGQVHEGQKMQFRTAPSSPGVSLGVDYGAITVDRLEKFERVKVPKVRLTLLARFPLDDKSAIWLKDTLGTTVFLQTEDVQLEIPGTRLTEILAEPEPIDRKSRAAGERDEDPRTKRPVPSAVDAALSPEAEERAQQRDAERLAANDPLPASPRTKRVGKKGGK